MIVTLSERRLSELIRQLEGINDSDSEIAFRMQYYAGRVFKHVADAYNLHMVGLLEHQGDIGSFQFDISRIGRNWETGDFGWDKLIGGLQFINALAVTVEAIDMEWICTGLIATSATDAFDDYAHELQRLSVAEVRPKIEAVLLKYVWNGSGPQRNSTGNTELDRHFDTQDFQAQLARAGDDKSLELLRSIIRSDAVDDYKQAEEAAYKAREDAAHKQWGIDRD
jgi:hypothetical protein